MTARRTTQHVSVYFLCRFGCMGLLPHRPVRSESVSNKAILALLMSAFALPVLAQPALPAAPATPAIPAAPTVAPATPAIPATPATPGIDKRQAIQDRRIDRGAASGRLTEREERRLERGQAKVQKLEDKAKADGTVTKRERARIHQGQNVQSARIAKQKHDRQHGR
jgi:hypothetical protein